jgi:hypothetical protein
MGKMLAKLQRKTRHFHAHETARFDELSGLPLASFRQRAYAIAIDLLIIAIIRSLFGWQKHHEDGSPLTMAKLIMEGIHHIEELVESGLYFAVLLKFGKGQTPGKWVMKCRVVSLVHEGMGWWPSIERALGYGASLLEGGFGFAQFFFTRNRQCVHDRIAETIVLDVRPTARRLANEDSEKVDAPLG